MCPMQFPVTRSSVLRLYQFTDVVVVLNKRSWRVLVSQITRISAATIIAVARTIAGFS